MLLHAASMCATSRPRLTATTPPRRQSEYRFNRPVVVLTIVLPQLDAFCLEMEELIKNRVKTAKLRPVPNAAQQVNSFNESATPQNIAEHNDPHRIDWTDVSASPPYFVGNDVLYCFLHDTIDATGSTNRFRTVKLPLVPPDSKWPPQHG
jgi:hypothetical protein